MRQQKRESRIFLIGWTFLSRDKTSVLWRWEEVVNAERWTTDGMRSSVAGTVSGRRERGGEEVKIYDACRGDGHFLV